MGIANSVIEVIVPIVLELLNFGAEEGMKHAVDGRLKRSAIDDDPSTLWTTCGPGDRCISKNSCNLVGLLVNVSVAIDSFDCGPTLVCCSMKEAVMYGQQKIEGKTWIEKFSQLLIELIELEKNMERKNVKIDSRVATDTTHPFPTRPHPIKDFTEKRHVSIDHIS